MQYHLYSQTRHSLVTPENASLVDTKPNVTDTQKCEHETLDPLPITVRSGPILG